MPLITTMKSQLKRAGNDTDEKKKTEFPAKHWLGPGLGRVGVMRVLGFKPIPFYTFSPVLEPAPSTCHSSSSP